MIAACGSRAATPMKRRPQTHACAGACVSSVTHVRK